MNDTNYQMDTWTKRQFWWGYVLRHFRKVMIHKWFILLAAHRLPFGVPPIRWWQLISHDMSKFSAIERHGYILNFYFRIFAKGWAEWEKDIDTAWKDALRHHYRSNPHHWQYWCDDHYQNPRPMPARYVREMVADWMAASRSSNGTWPQGVWPWLEKNWWRMQLHPHTRHEVLFLLIKMGINVPPFPGETHG